MYIHINMNSIINYIVRNLIPTRLGKVREGEDSNSHEEGSDTGASIPASGPASRRRNPCHQSNYSHSESVTAYHRRSSQIPMATSEDQCCSV